MLRETVRSDGLRIITKRMPHTKKVRVSVSAMVGAAYDPPGMDGLFHLFEHMAFKGTIRWNAKELTNIIKRYFLDHNAVTEDLRTTYWCEGTPDQFGKMFDFLGEIYFNSIFPADELEKEKEVVLNEATSDNEDPNQKVYWALRETLWRKNPLRRQGVGSFKAMKAVNRESLLSARNQWHIPANTVIVAVGKLDHGHLLDLANKLIPVNDAKPAHLEWDDEFDSLPAAKEIVMDSPVKETALILYGAKMPRFDLLASKVRYNLLSLYLGQLLWEEIREKRGLVYGVYSQKEGQRRLGYSMILSAETLPSRFYPVKDLMADIIFGDKFIDPTLFQMVKDNALNVLSVAHESAKEWDETIHEVVIDEGIGIKLLRHYDNTRHQLVSETDFEEIEALRKKLIVPERFVCATTKP